MKSLDTARPVALIVEDAPTVRLILTAQLRKLGFDVVALSDGDAVLAAAHRNAPALVCLDLMLPNVCGLEVVEQLRADPATRTVPIIITSSRRTPQDRVNAETAGADAYLLKPFDQATLETQVRALVPGGCPSP
jgi:two-component system phosphate regulon response regulator PhoB